MRPACTNCGKCLGRRYNEVALAGVSVGNVCSHWCALRLQRKVVQVPERFARPVPPPAPHPALAQALEQARPPALIPWRQVAWFLLWLAAVCLLGWRLLG